MRKTRFFYVNVILLVVLLNKMCVYGSTAAGEMKEHRSEPEIRVVLTDSDFQSVYHDSVTISLDEEETVYEAKNSAWQKRNYFNPGAGKRHWHSIDQQTVRYACIQWENGDP